MKHQTISFVKSGIRILGYSLIPLIYITPFKDFGLMLLGIGGTLIFSELIGIVEEIGHE